MIPLVAYLILAAIVFGIGAFGFITSKNVIRILMSVELMLNSANINFVAFSSYSIPFDISGQIFALFTIALAAAESAVGIAILILLYRTHGTVKIQDINVLRW
ncbi:MAG: NADH-quinone oxidoreductase subunit NuoK [Methanocellales archaeon]